MSFPALEASHRWLSFHCSFRLWGCSGCTAPRSASPRAQQQSYPTAQHRLTRSVSCIPETHQNHTTQNPFQHHRVAFADPMLRYKLSCFFPVQIADPVCSAPLRRSPLDTIFGCWGAAWGCIWVLQGPGGWTNSMGECSPSQCLQLPADARDGHRATAPRGREWDR